MTVWSGAIHTHAYHCLNIYMCLPLFPMVLWTNRFSFCLRVHIRERSVQSYPFKIGALQQLSDKRYTLFFSLPDCLCNY